MTAPLPPKYPVVSFALLGLTLLLGGLGTLGAFAYLYFYFPDPSQVHNALILAVNGLLCWVLAILCALSAWRLFKRVPKALSFASVIWVFTAAFTLWILLFDGLRGWSNGGIAEVVVWGVLEALAGIGLIRARRSS